MGLFDYLKPSDINKGVQICAETAGAMLPDVCNADEYAAGHIPGSINLPLPMTSEAGQRMPDKATPLFVYCLAGTRSGRATDALKDADVIRHCMNDLSKPVKDKERARFGSSCVEFGMERV